MSGDIVNLGKVRKAKSRVEKERQAAENRVVHGRSKPEKQREAAEKARVKRELDGARRDRGGAPDDER